MWNPVFDFPIPTKSKNHKDFLPIGLIKLAALLESKGNEVQLVRGNQAFEHILKIPSEIWITSLFTYWIEDVRRSVKHYRNLFPEATIKVGGIKKMIVNWELLKKIKSEFGYQVNFCSIVGESEPGVSRVIHGRRELTKEQKMRWAAVLRCKVEEIFQVQEK